MALVVKVDDHEYTVNVMKEEENYRFQFDGQERLVNILKQESGNLTLLVDNVPYVIVLEKDGEVFVNDERYATEVLDEQVQKLMKASPDTFEKKDIAVKAPMPGLIIDICIAEGDRVKRGDGVVIVEAMKMQNEMKAPRDGIIKKLKVKKGETVNSGDTLIVIE